MKTLKIGGVVTKGFRIASGLNTEGVPGPRGIVIKDSFLQQRPFFEKEIPEMRTVWSGTINVDISPHTHTMLGFDHTITCEWCPGIIETFGIVSNITLQHKNVDYTGFIYYPMPSPFHDPRLNIIEVLAPKVGGLSYGDQVTLLLPADKVTIR